MTSVTTKTINVLGMELPIIADLGDGWFLAAHPNGAGIARDGFLAVLSSESAETILPSHGPIDDPDIPVELTIPEVIRAAAVEEFERLAWPMVRGLFFKDGKA